MEAASRRDDEGYRTQLTRAEATLAQVEPSDDPAYLAQKRLHEELRARGQAAVLNDRDLQLRAHEAQYRTRRSRPLRSDAGTGGGPGLVDRGHLLPWVDLPIPRPPQAQSSPELERRVRGMLLGLAVGDSLGNATESQLPERRRLAHGEIRHYLPNRHAEARAVGVPSDDTQLAFWTVESLLSRGGIDPEDLARAFSTKHIFGIGGTVRAFLRQLKGEGKTWYEAGQPSAGNGALMRIAPVVLPYLRRPTTDLWRDVIAATVVTHRDEAAVAADVGFVGLLAECLALQGGATPTGRWWPETFLRYARPAEQGVDYVPRSPHLSFRGSLCDLVESEVLPAVDGGLSALEAQGRWYSGAYLLETVPCVLHILALHGHDPEDALVRAVNDTKDNDTVAAIVGAAVGALHGEEALPRPWREGLLGRLGVDDDGAVQDLIARAVNTFVER